MRGRILAACVAEHDWSAPPPQLEGEVRLDASLLVAAARFHGVAGCLLHSLRHVLPAGSPIVTGLEELYLVSLASHLQVLAELPPVADALDAKRIPWMVLKGPVLAEVIYRRADLRAYGDLDLLVAPEDFESALSALEQAGYRVQDRNWDLLLRRMLGEVQLLSPRGTPIDLHWHPLNEVTMRESFPIDARALFARVRRVEVGGRSVRTPSAPHTLAYLALHSARSGGNRLVWLKDLEQSILFDHPPWDEVVDVATRWRVGLPCAVMLRRARKALGADVSGEVLSALEQGGRWGTLASIVDRLAPVERSVGHRSPARAFARATRTDDRSSVAALAGAVVEAVRERRLDLTPPAPDADPRSGESIHHDRGGDAGRDRFLAAVSANADRSRERR